MDTPTIITLIIIVSASFSYINQRFIKLPGTIGVMVISVIVSMLILFAGKLSADKYDLLSTLAHNIDFSKVLLDVMLGFLLFAMALHFDNKKLKAHRTPVIILSTLGVLVSTVVFGGLLYFFTKLLTIKLPLIYCFIFGALISPTDPIAVSSIIRRSKISTKLETIISGESMFNDAAGLILFVTCLGIAKHGEAGLSFEHISRLFLHEIMGGFAIGLILGFAGYRLIRSIYDFQTIFLLSIALVFGISLIATKLHASVPLAVIAAGLYIGNQNFGENHPANQYLGNIWQLLDEVLNTILFVMIGLQLIILPFLNNYWLIGLISIFIILVARMVSVSLPAFFKLRKLNLGNLFILTWAGLRGGISIAMALSLPPSPYRELILSGCYFIVIFSIIIQGLSLGKVIEKINTAQQKN
jgi:CPA1 family monovalent cation:H+ antiporter